MSAIASMTLTDGQATPVSHVLAPKQVAPFAVWREDLAGVPAAGQLRVKLTTKFSDRTDGINRVRLVLELPVMEAVLNQNAAGYTAAPKVAYVNTVILDWLLPFRSTAQDRKNLRALTIQALSAAAPAVVDSIETLATPY